MSYLVLARKWRPKFFDDVVGQEHVARTLENSIEQDRVHHAYLFCGARGVGKTSTARILAKCLNCEEGPTTEPCYECDSCRDITEGQSVDVYEIDGASNRGINEIRELREGVRYAPSQARFKIYIIDEVHMLTTEAFNALLKTLEEPPDHAYFIFATTEPQDIPITILSRCQRFDFKRIGQDEIVGHLKHICEQEEIEAEEAGLQLIARQAEGAMRDALSLLDQVIGFAGDSVTEEQVADILGVANREHLFDISTAILRRDPEAALDALDVVHRYGYDLQQFASELVAHLRDLTVTAAVEEPGRVTNLTSSELEDIREQLGEMEVEGDARRQLLHRYFETMAEGARKMSRSPYPKLILEMTLVRLTDLEPLVELDLLADQLEELEGEFEGIEPAGLPEGSSSGTGGGRGAGRPDDRSSDDKGGDEDEGDARGDEEDDGVEESRESPEPASAEEADPSASDEQVGPDADSGPRDQSEIEASGADADEAEVQSETEASPSDEGELEREDADAGASDGETTSSAAGSSPGEGPAPSVEREEHPGMEPPPMEPPAAMGSPGEPSEGADTEGKNGERVGTADEQGADTVELGDPVEMWQEVVETICEEHGSHAVKFERAHPERFEDGRIILGCEEKYESFFADEHCRDIETVAGDLFGGDWTVEIDAWDADEAEDWEGETLAERREQRRREREASVRESVLDHATVDRAMELFDVEEEQVDVDVELSD